MSEEYEDRIISLIELHAIGKKWEVFVGSLDHTPTPEESLLAMFDAMEAKKLPLYQLLLWGTLCGSLSENITQGVLSNLVDMKTLRWEKDEEGTTWFNLVEKEENQIQ